MEKGLMLLDPTTWTLRDWDTVRVTGTGTFLDPALDLGISYRIS